MTLTVALRGADGMVAASDSRGTFGDPRGVTAQNDTMTKLFALTPHVVVTLAGAAELGVQLMGEVEPTLRAQGVDGASAVMEAVRGLTRQRYSEWFPGWQIQPSAMPAPPVRPDLAAYFTGNGHPVSREMDTLFRRKWPPCFTGNGHPLVRSSAAPA